MYLLEARRAQIREALRQAHRDASERGELPQAPFPPCVLEEPRSEQHGDLATNVALQLALGTRLGPRQVAAALVAGLTPQRIPVLERAEVAGPGFINIYFRDGWLAPAVGEILAAGLDYGASAMGQGRRVLVEFVSANPTGPLNVVNCRAAAFGDSLVRCLNAAGYRAEAEFYVNDAGGQFRKLGLSLEARLRRLRGEAAEVPEGGYPGDYLVAMASRYADERGMDVLEQEPERRITMLARYAVDRILQRQREVLERFGVHFDHFSLESDIRAARGPERVVEELSARGYTEERDGALWLKTEGAGDNDDRVLRKRDGEYTYRVPDIAYHAGKFERGYDLLIDIYGHDHHGEVQAVRLALEWLGYPVDHLEVLLTQMIRLLRDGREEKISKRSGNFISMEDFLDEVGVDAARFFFLTRTIDTHMDFDVELAKRQSQDNPVYYVQYAHARICSILRQAGELVAEADAAPLVHPAETALLRALAALPDEIAAAASSRAPHRLTAYARQTAERFHGFYAQCRVLGGEPAQSRARLALCSATQIVLARVLGLLGVSAPQSM